MTQKTQFNMRIDKDLRASLDIIGAEMLLSGEIQKPSATSVVVKLIEDLVAERKAARSGVADGINAAADPKNTAANKPKKTKGGG